MNTKTLLKVPVMKTDEELEAFLDQDLSDLDFSQFKPANFEFSAKDARVTMRLPEALVGAIKAAAAGEGIPYQRFIRRALEQALEGGRGKLGEALRRL